jgi:hypothetical protein
MVLFPEQMCMLACRNYIELALSRPSKLRDPASSAAPSTFEKLMEQAATERPRGEAGKVIVARGGSSDPSAALDRLSAAERRELRGAFVRIGRPQGEAGII